MKATAMLVLIGMAGCGGGGGGEGDDINDAPSGSDIDAAAGEDLDMQAADFECLLGWDKVRRFRITNKLGHLTEALATANTPGTADYPVGTVIQLVPFEASVKRRVGFNPASNDWEFFSLQVDSSGTTILDRGTTDVENQFGGNCFGCHVLAEPQWDFVCETGHGCETLPLTEAQIESLQNNDARCP
jgi:hypothetical protein